MTNDDRDLCFEVRCGAETACGEAGVCDPANGQCTYAPKSRDTECRASAGDCDVAETCTGIDTVCPPDGFQVGTVCRQSAGDCDVAESCSGKSAACPPDGFADLGTMCRASAGDCDVAEQCTGFSASCPSDAFLPATEACRTADGLCDVTEHCTGFTGTCPDNGFAPSTTECRRAAGDCDVNELCTGFAAACPDDAFRPSTEVCRTSAGDCDVAEQCTGAAAGCPDDGYAPGTKICRAAAGLCDVADACTGLSARCPDDRFAEVGTECRASTNSCDPVEVCTGVTAGCPTDVAGACTLCGDKFYDANANGSYDPDELGIAGWRFELTAAGTTYATTDAGGGFSFSKLPAGDYTLCESSPLESNWLQIAPATRCVTVAVPSALAESCTINFGNLCLGWGGGHTIGYWTNQSGKASFLGADGGASSLALIASLNLVNGSGSVYDPTTYQQFATWLNNASATNMAYMLSAQLAAMELNVKTEIVDGADLVYAPATSSASSLGFATIDDLLAEANAELGLHATTFDGSPFRAYQEALKNGLDRANNNLNFVQPAACTRTFATP